MGRPLHFFGGFGALGIVAGSAISAGLLVLKLLHPHQNVMDQHGPLFVVGGVMIVSGIQLLAIGLLASCRCGTTLPASKRRRHTRSTAWCG